MTQALSWLDEFFAPWLELTDSAAADYEIELDLAPGAFAELRRETDGEPSSRVETFVQDGRVNLDACWQDGRGGILVRLAHREVGYRIHAAERRARVVAEHDTREARLPLMRTVRELVMIAARRRGALLVHGAAFAREGRAVVVCGPRETGKTTFLLHALADRELGLLTNDRVLVRLDGTGAVARGVPTIVSIRDGTLAMLPELAERLRQSRFHYALSLAEIASSPADEKLGIRNPSPLQLCRLLDVRPVAEGALAAFVFPARASGAELSLERVAGEQAEELLWTSLLGGPGPWGSASLWLGSDLTDEPTPEASRERCRALAAQVPVYRCAIGPAALADRRAMSDLVSTLTR